MSALLALALAGAAAPSAPDPFRRCTVDTCATGSWTGALPGGDWTLEFKLRNAAWTGGYITTRGRSWHPPLDLDVAGGAVTFGIGSTPELTFRLALDPARDALAGQVDGLRVMPFTATRTG